MLKRNESTRSALNWKAVLGFIISPMWVPLVIVLVTYFTNSSALGAVLVWVIILSVVAYVGLGLVVALEALGLLKLKKFTAAAAVGFTFGAVMTFAGMALLLALTHHVLAALAAAGGLYAFILVIGGAAGALVSTTYRLLKGALTS